MVAPEAGPPGGTGASIPDGAYKIVTSPRIEMADGVKKSALFKQSLEKGG
jgi:hypothetical protein